VGAHRVGERCGRPAHNLQSRGDPHPPRGTRDHLYAGALPVVAPLRRRLGRDTLCRSMRRALGVGAALGATAHLATTLDTMERALRFPFPRPFGAHVTRRSCCVRRCVWSRPGHSSWSRLQHRGMEAPAAMGGSRVEHGHALPALECHARGARALNRARWRVLRRRSGRSYDRGPRPGEPGIARYREITALRRDEAVSRGYPLRHFFPHRFYYLPKCGPMASRSPTVCVEPPIRTAVGKSSSTPTSR